MFDPAIQDMVLHLSDSSIYSNFKVVETRRDDSIVSRICHKSNSIFNIKKIAEVCIIEYDHNNYSTLSLISSDITHQVVMSDGNSDMVGTDLEGVIPSNISDGNALYLFSHNFYSGTTPISRLEKVILDYTNNDIINMDDLVTIAENIPEWTEAEKFYYIPFVILLMDYGLMISGDRI